MAEADFYRPIKTFVENKLSFCGYENIFVDITANKISHVIWDHFPNEFSVLERRIYPDLVALYTIGKKRHSIAIEVKDDPLKMQDIFQALGYGKILKSEKTFLISPYSIPDEIKDFLIKRKDILKSGKSNIYIGKIDNGEINDGDWFPNNPF